MLKLRLAARYGYIALRGSSRDVPALALDDADWLHHDHQPHHHDARRQATVRALWEAIVANLIFGALLAWRSL
jgi:hypothetical protein